jgi:hypothetical protein
MTDIIPNDLSHLSDAEFFALCPIGEHAPGPEPLSPAAQVVMDAYCTEADLRNREVTDCEMLAAALRAAALYCKRDSVILLSLADELEQ